MKVHFLVLVSVFLVSFSAHAQTTPSPPPVVDSDESQPPLPECILEKQGYYSLSAGYLQLQAPAGKIDMAQIDLNYLWVNQGIAQLYQLRLGLSGRSQSL